MPLREFRTVNCEELLKATQAKYNVSSTTLKHLKHLLSGLFRYAIRTGVISHSGNSSPLRRVGNAPGIHKERRCRCS